MKNHSAFVVAALLIVIMFSVGCARLPTQRADALTQVIALVDHGRFAQAEQRVAAELARPDSNQEMCGELEFQRERMRRIRIDFALSAAEVKAQLRASIPDLRDDELARWDGQGRIEHYVIDGQVRYFKSAARNLFYLSDEARSRRRADIPPEPEPPLYAAHQHHRDVIAAVRTTGKQSVLPVRVRVTHSIAVKADAVPAGETVRAWLPFPRAIPGQQEDMRLLSSSPTGAHVAPESSLQRTAYLERKAQAGKTTDFSITYELTLFARHAAIDPDQVKPTKITPELADFMRERPPHVVFTDALRSYSRAIVDDEENPYRIAQRLFAAVDGKIWGVAREYSTLSNISDYAFHSEHADCGQQTLLLITLLRLNGIPARWQSGWEISPGTYDNMHDWGQLWLDSYGWVPMDVTHGRLQDADPAVEWFYLGGLDAYHIAFNDDYGRPFTPARQHPRSETVDLQRGEVEWSGGNVYFDQWDYAFDWKILPASASRP